MCYDWNDFKADLPVVLVFLGLYVLYCLLAVM